MKFQRADRVKSEKPSRNRRARIMVLFIFLELCFALLIYRTFSLQCIQGAALQVLADGQYRKDVFTNAKRGAIYDRNLQPLAVTVTTHSLYADPSVLEKQESVARSLASVLSLSRAEILRKLNSNRRFVWLKRKLPDQIVDKVRSLKVSGLGFKEEEKRFYPKGSLAAHVIGFVGLDNIGLDGIERAYDSYMKGHLQKRQSQKDPMGRDLTPREVEYDIPTHGYDVVLTMDEVIQHIAEVELQRACKKSRARSGSVVLMVPRTGEILALANYPTYDLNEASRVSDDRRRNRAIRDLYEPGSAFKIVTAAAVLNEGLVTTGERIDCENGVYRSDGYTIRDAHKHESLTFSEIIEQSSNIGAVKIASRLGDRRLYKYIEAFGLNGKTGVDLSDRAGFVRPPASWTKRSMAAVPFGQEIAITPLQMLCSANAIANDGVMMKPFIVRSINDGQDPLIAFAPQESATPVSRETARVLKQILVRAVENGTGRNARVYGYTVGGKTGTAQKASGEGGYLPGKYIGSFVGFLSAKESTISMIVVINEPQGDDYTGSAVACPVFRKIAIQVMQYLTISQRAYAAELKPTG